ncbi:E3 ubiquitin-protein ligase RDUF1 [Linum grandiflorum]
MSFQARTHDPDEVFHEMQTTFTGTNELIAEAAAEQHHTTVSVEIHRATTTTHSLVTPSTTLGISTPPFPPRRRSVELDMLQHSQHPDHDIELARYVEAYEALAQQRRTAVPVEIHRATTMTHSPVTPATTLGISTRPFPRRRRLSEHARTSPQDTFRVPAAATLRRANQARIEEARRETERLFASERRLISPEEEERAAIRLHQILELFEEVKSKTGGASESAIEKLERVEIGGSGWKHDDCCSICLEDMVCGAARAIRMDCTHEFHENCLLSWLNNSNICPLCRFLVSD